jgi:hemoglobin-like flavoprotein
VAELSAVRVLRAASTGLDAAAVVHLANARPLGALEELVLDGNVLGDEGVIGLATAGGLRALERLSLRDVGVGARGAAALAASGMIGRLSRLDLSYNQLGDAGAEALAHGPGWQRLGELYLTDNEMGLAGVAAILASPAMEVLHRLDVSRNALTGIVDLHGLAEAQVQLLESSFAEVAVMGTEFTARFYELLFERYPMVKPLFAHVSMSRQHQHLLTALTAVIDNIRAPDALEPKLTAMGERHVGYGTLPTHYHAVTSTLLDALEEAAGAAWSDALHAAWSDGLEAVARVMMNAHRHRSAAS